MTYHYEWDNTEEDSAIHIYHLMLLLKKLGIGYTYVEANQNHVCDTTLTVRYKVRRGQQPD